MRAVIVCILVLMSMAAGVRANAQDSASAVPAVAEHAAPNYPPLARQTRISGDVRVMVTTDGEAVTNAEAVSGHPLLRKAAEDNVRTWKFATNSSPSTFFVTFRYKLTSGNADVEFLEEPGVIRLTDSPPTISAYYSNLDMGTWGVELTCIHGKLLRILEMSTTGPGEGLDIKFMDEKEYRKEEGWKRRQEQEEDEEDEVKDEQKDKKGNEQEIDFGHTEKEFVSFAAKLEWRAGKRTTTVFVGKINGDRIIWKWAGADFERVRPEDQREVIDGDAPAQQQDFQNISGWSTRHDVYGWQTRFEHRTRTQANTISFETG